MLYEQTIVKFEKSGEQQGCLQRELNTVIFALSKMTTENELLKLLPSTPIDEFLTAYSQAITDFIRLRQLLCVVLLTWFVKKTAIAHLRNQCVG